MYINLIADKQPPHSKVCLGVSIGMAMGTSLKEFEEFLSKVGLEYKNAQVSITPPWGLIEAKLYALKFRKDLVVHNDKNPKGPAIVVVKSEKHPNTLHAIYMDDKNSIHDPNPDTNDGRDISTYQVVSWYEIIPFRND